jgi:hypothetical protein
MTFKIGDKVRITGKTGGCEWANSKKCFDCPTFKNKVLEVKAVRSPRERNDRNIECKDGEHNNCNFMETDLSLDEINWKERIEANTVAKTKAL